MIKIYNLFSDCKRGSLKLSSNTSNGILFQYLKPYIKEKLPNNITFNISSGTKPYDIIELYESGSYYFFSKKFIDVISRFVDMTDKCYPIKIENTDEQYYVIYNLEECRYLNKEKALFNEEPHFFLGKEITTPLSCVTNTLFVFVTEEVKQCLIENKISNIFFREDYLCTEKEYRDWQINRINL